MRGHKITINQLLIIQSSTYIVIYIHYGLLVVEFSREGCKVRKVLAKYQHTQRKILNFENWTNGEPQ